MAIQTSASTMERIIMNIGVIGVGKIGGTVGVL